jgi:AcrR family transcriptional regulator
MKEIKSKRELNKAKKEALFINAAEKLFMEKGFENTSIDEVAKEAGLTKRTLYQYFQSKEDLFYAIAVQGAKELYEASIEAISKGNNALEKIRLANLAHLQFYLDNLKMFRILNYQPVNRLNSEASTHYQEIQILDGLRMKSLAELATEGKSDGSINHDLDIKKAIFYAFFASFSMLYTISSTDKSIWTALNLDENEFLHFSFDLIINALK